MTEDFEMLFPSAAVGDGRGRTLLVLALLLCLVFFMAVGAYGYFAEEEEKGGDIPGAVAVLRDFVSGNESVAVFLGFENVVEEEVEAGAESDPAYEARVKEKAAAYIAERQGGA